MSMLGKAVAASLAALLGLAACSGDAPEGASVGGDETTAASQSGSPTPSPSKTASPSPTSKPTGDLERQLYDATEAFYIAVSESYQTLDPALIKPLVWPNTQAGHGYADAIEDMKAKGHRFVGAPTLTISNFRLGKQDANPDQQTIYISR